MIFASDGPWLHPGLELYKIKLLGLGTEDERLILGENIMRLMRKRVRLPRQDSTSAKTLSVS